MNSKHISKRLLQSLLLVLFFWISIFTYAPWFWEWMYRGDGEYEATYEGFIFQNYNLTFPDISLSKPGTYTYVAKGLQTNNNPSVVIFMENVDDFDMVNLDVEVSVTIKDSDGETFYEVSGSLLGNRAACGLHEDEYRKFSEAHPTYWYALPCGQDSKLRSTHHSFVIGYYGQLDWSWWEEYTVEITVDQHSRRYTKLVGRLKIQSGWK